MCRGQKKGRRGQMSHERDKGRSGLVGMDFSGRTERAGRMCRGQQKGRIGQIINRGS
jgi:hypothetical protein